MENVEKTCLDAMFDRTKLLIEEDKLEKIKNSNICICGIGGVGSYTLEAIARMGVGKITVIDKDKVAASNINRQLVASWYTVGMEKVEVAKVHVDTINPDAEVTAVCDYLDTVNIDKYITKDYDYVVDAVDSISAKLAIIKRCKELNVPVISCMGMGNKLDPLKIKVTDISKTNTCPLAKLVRKRLKEMNIQNVKVIFSEEEPKKNSSNILGSVPFVPSVAGLVIASEVIKDLCQEGRS